MRNNLADLTWRERGSITKKTRSERSILDAARYLFETLGYDRTTVESIAARAGVGPATIYQTYNSKAVLATAVFAEKLGDLKTPATKDVEFLPVKDCIRRHFKRVAVVYKRYRPLAQAVFEALSRTSGPAVNPKDPRLIFPLPEALAFILQTAQERGEIGPDVDIDDVAGSLTSFLMIRIQSRNESATASSDFITKAAMSGLLSTPKA